MHENKIAKSLQKRMIWLRKLKKNVVITEDRTDDRCSGWYKNSISHVGNEPPFYLETTEESYCIEDYKRTCISTVHGFISATRRF